MTSLQLMSNHSKEVPSGYLDKYNFRTFFGVEEGPDGLKWLPGQERVPENWVNTSSSVKFHEQADSRLVPPPILRTIRSHGRPRRRRPRLPRIPSHPQDRRQHGHRQLLRRRERGQPYRRRVERRHSLPIQQLRLLRIPAPGTRYPGLCQQDLERFGPSDQPRQQIRGPRLGRLGVPSAWTIRQCKFSSTLSRCEKGIH
jgi:hypothetical protein